MDYFGFDGLVINFSRLLFFESDKIFYFNAELGRLDPV